MLRPMFTALVLATLFGGCAKSPVVQPTSQASTDQPSAATSRALRDEPELQPVPAAGPKADAGASAAFERLISAAENNDPAAWTAAEQELQQLGERVVPTLLPVLRADEPLRRELAVMLLAQLGPLAAPAADDLAKLLNDPSPVVRVNAASVLTTLEQPPPQAIETLTALLNEADVSIRITAIASLGNAGPLLAASAAPRLEQCLADTEPRVRSAATLAIGQFGPSAKGLLPRIRLLSNDEDAAVRDAVTQAVQQIEGDSPLPQ